MTFKSESEDERARQQNAGAAREMLEEALSLAVKIDRLLTNPRCASGEADTFRIRLARAHTLSLLDQISDLLGSHEAESTVRPAQGDSHDDDVSGVRTLWR